MMKQKTRNGRAKLFLFPIVLTCSLLLAACMPPGYSSDKEKEVAKTGYALAQEWFEKNLPEAQINNDAKAYTTSLDLLRAVQGTYDKSKTMHESFDYIYDYENERMYLSQDYQNVVALVRDEMKPLLGLKYENIEVDLRGIKFSTTTENDKDSPNPAAALPGDMAGSDYEPLIPALVDPMEYAHSIVYDGEMGFSLDIDLDILSAEYKDPVYDPQIFKICPSLSSLRYNIMTPEKPDYKGLAFASFSEEGPKYVWIHMVKERDDLYVGFCTDLSDKTPDVDFVNTTWDEGEGLLSFSVPEGTTALLLTNEGEYYDVVKESDGTESKSVWEAEIWSSEDKGIRKYKYYRLHLQFPAIGYPNLVLYSMQEPGKTEYNFKLPEGDYRMVSGYYRLSAQSR